MSMGGIFLSVKNLITTNLNMSSQPSISTGAKLELWIAVGSRLCMVEGKYHNSVELVLSICHYSSNKYNRGDKTCQSILVSY